MTRPAVILAIDDDELLLAVSESCLAAEGHTVLCAGDGAAGLALAARQPPDAIVLDMLMPGLDGRQVLQALKADATLAAIPVLMLTASRREDDVAGARARGATDYLVKPFKPEVLVARVARLLRKPAARREGRKNQVWYVRPANDAVQSGAPRPRYVRATTSPPSSWPGLPDARGGDDAE